jgi:hypothetical protein
MNESIILKCRFEVAICDHKFYLERLRKYSNETKIISIEDNSFGLDDYKIGLVVKNKEVVIKHKYKNKLNIDKQVILV